MTVRNGHAYYAGPDLLAMLFDVADNRVVRISPLDEKTGEGYVVEFCDRDTGQKTQEFGESPSSLNEALRFAIGAYYRKDTQ